MAANTQPAPAHQPADRSRHDSRRARYIDECFAPTETSPSMFRQDRILDEARHTADPVHLVRVFGITESTAIYYVHAAHPGRQSVIPR